MLTRRSVMMGSVAAEAVKPERGFAQDSWQDLLADAMRPGNPLTLGRRVPPSNSPLWREAKIQMDLAKKQKDPYKIMKYFVTSLDPKFQTAWPEPNPNNPTLANPLIMLLFVATKTKPEGDKTAWCGAGMNWCLANSTPGATGTGSASSQSFLDYGQEVWNASQSWPPVNARRGDIAVFTLKSEPSHGHVAFFDQPTSDQPNRVDVLGANQFDRVGSHTFNTSSIRINERLRLATIRTAPYLREI